jgi:phosphoribosylaminoimidazole-succinocarboxamide synthase
MASTSLPETPAVRKIASGKVRDLYTHPTSPSTALVFVASDRISAFDVVLAPGIPDKGALLTLMSAHWFATLPSLVTGGSPDTTAVPFKHHLLSLGVPQYDGLESVPADEKKRLDKRTMQVRKMNVIPLEAIVRGYLTGSAWAEYSTHGTVHGIPLPAGLQKSQRLPTGPLYTPSTKAPPGQHDENIHPDTAAAIVGASVAEKVKQLALAVYAAAAEYAEARGIIIAQRRPARQASYCGSSTIKEPSFL